MSGTFTVPHIESCSDQEFQELSDLHATYQGFEKIALVAGPGAQDAHDQLVRAVSRSIVCHFRPNAKGEYNLYQVQKIVIEKAANGTQRYFVHYTPLYDAASAVLYRRLLVGEMEGEESGWLLPVKKPGYQGKRFITATS